MFVDECGNIFNFEGDHYCLSEAVSDVVFAKEIDGYPINEIKILPKIDHQIRIVLREDVEYKIDPDFNHNKIVNFISLHKDFEMTTPVPTIVDHEHNLYEYFDQADVYITYRDDSARRIASRNVAVLSETSDLSNDPVANVQNFDRAVPSCEETEWCGCKYVFVERVLAFVCTTLDSPCWSEDHEKLVDEYPLYNLRLF